MVAWRARWVSDPVERLRFLRVKAQAWQPRNQSQDNGKWLFRYPPAPAVTLGLTFLAITILQPSGTVPIEGASHEVRSVPTADWAPEGSSSLPNVWLVETSKLYDLYSNGLRVENQFTVATAPRKYLAFARIQPDTLSGEWRSRPAGIVFHTTESHLAPFEEDQNRALRREGEGLLEYVNRRRAYHFVIDRFGRVFRVVQESDYANHAGNSVWADDDWIYLNLNQSFLGIAFEAQSSPGNGDLPANPAQIHAGRILVEMLRARYGIPQGNCIAHAQVSVNPSNGRAGYHTDWAANLPFGDLGLSDNYRRPLPSVALFGFEADTALLEARSELDQGVKAAEALLQTDAAAREMPEDSYRKILQERFRRAIREQQSGSSANGR